MERWLGRWSEQVYAVFRMVLGAMFLMHGMQKLFAAFPETAHGPQGWANLSGQMKVGGVIEFVGGAMVLLGLEAGWAAFFCSGMMAVAYFQAHSKAEAPLPIQNGGELAVIYCFAFLLIAAKGSGKWSVSRALRKAA